MLAITSAARQGRHRSGVALVVFGLVLVSGCNPDPYPEDLKYPLRSDLLVLKVPGKRDIPQPEPLGSFEQALDNLKSDEAKEEGADVLDPADLPADARSELDAQLEQIFGSPSEPTIEVRKGDRASLKDLGLAEEGTMARGSVLYRRYCVHCHGLTGDGRGPTAPWVNPHPRDYRRGFFKFASVKSGPDSRPLRSDLHRTLQEGIEGTSMPNFRQLPEKELQDLISYVMHLSIRGSVEFSIMSDLLSRVREARKAKRDVDKVVKDFNIASKVQTALTAALGQWADTSSIIQVQPYPYDPTKPPSEESIRNGHRLFIEVSGGGCIQCHNDYGRQAGFLYDKWGTLVRPANLTAGVYRGGRRPLDIYFRISGGIDASQMSAASSLEKDPKKIWDLVNFVKVLPYPNMLPADVRERIYGTKKD